jgi:hypothetical protein
MNGDTAIPGQSANDFIERYCIVSDEPDPLAMALTLMTAVEFLNNNAGTTLPASWAPECEFSHRNQECPATECT